MLSLRDEPFPTATVRDLLGIARAVHRHWSATGADPTRLAQLERIGRELREALDLGRRSEPHTLGHAGALSRAERATAELCALVGGEALAPAIEATAADVRRRR